MLVEHEATTELGLRHILAVLFSFCPPVSYLAVSYESRLRKCPVSYLAVSYASRLRECQCCLARRWALIQSDTRLALIDTRAADDGHYYGVTPVRMRGGPTGVSRPIRQAVAGTIAGMERWHRSVALGCRSAPSAAQCHTFKGVASFWPPTS